jgi:phosphoglucosamine mutase
LGIALDGDADRVIFVDETGTVVNGDQIMGLIAWDRQRKGRLRGPGIVATVMSNMGLEIALQEMNLSLLRTAVGDRYVVERMRADGFNFGGEQSGHLVFLDHSTTGDGLLAALQTLYVLLDTGKPLSELARRVTMFPQALKNVEVTERRDLGSVPEVRSAIAHAEALLGARGRILVRYSGTQLLCRVMAEGEHEDIVRNVVDTVADAITRYV